eukprot:TRINITY_DN8656_c0_g1_i1.p2 TRINITY_DN8656_c0_g1~~TRINITY_DN8656_c0_g1_i1.p2  ORF type:complete len:107 (-),score=12.73 TRINITY_DN8656_c0_g1_i1:72-392(-)
MGVEIVFDIWFISSVFVPVLSALLFHQVGNCEVRVWSLVFRLHVSHLPGIFRAHGYNWVCCNTVVCEENILVNQDRLGTLLFVEVFVTFICCFGECDCVLCTCRAG